MEQMEKDRLKDLFARLPNKSLSAGFQFLLMERIRQEALLRAEHRKERLNLLGIGALIISLLGALACNRFRRCPATGRGSCQG